MFTWAGGQIDAILDTYVAGALNQVFGWTAVLGAVMLTLYVLLYGLAVVRGEVSDPVLGFVWKVIKLGLILAVATVADAYSEFVQETVTAATTSMAAAFRPPADDSPEPTTIWSVLDDFNSQASLLVLAAFKTDTNKYIPNLMAYYVAAVFSIANAALLIVAFAITIFARSMQAFVFAVGPLFILALMWRPTAKFFDAWLGMLLSTVVLVWLAYFILGFSIGVSTAHIQRLITSFNLLNHAAESTAYFVLLVTFAFILYQAPSLAASLTGGGPSQYGAGVIRAIQGGIQALMPIRADQNGSFASGGSIRKGAGFSYAAGRAVGVGARRASAGAGAVASGVGSAGKYAYQRAAAMGRRILNK